MKRINYNMIVFWITFSISILIAGCEPLSDLPQATTLASTEVLVLPSPTFQPATSGTSVEATKVQSSEPPSISPVLPSVTMQPTLDAVKTKQGLLSLLENNNDCALPCLLGITPGVTGIDQIIDIAAPFGEITLHGNIDVHHHMTELSGTLSFVVWEENLRIPVGLSYYLSDNVADHLTLFTQAGREEGEYPNLSIKVAWGEPYFRELLDYYSIQNIVSIYGEPSSVLIAPFPDDPLAPENTLFPFSIVLYYEETGFFIEYIAPKEHVGSDLVGCPYKAAYLSIIVWNPEDNLSLKTVASLNSGLGMNELNLDFFQPLDDVTILTVGEFSQALAEGGSDSCVITAKKNWE